MENMNNLLKKAYDTIRREGVTIFLKKTKNYLNMYWFKNKNSQLGTEKIYVDVLFINGCMLPHPPRYRVSHQKEQLLAGNIVSNEVYFEDLDLDMVKLARVFIFFRCPYTEKIGDFIQLAKQNNKKVLFDVDDLVIDKFYTDQIKYIKEMKAEDRKLYDEGVVRIGQTLQLCDGAITTTERLATELRKYVPNVIINRNVASERMVELSELAVYKRDIYPYEKDIEHIHKFSKSVRKHIIKTHLERKNSFIRLGYFSGSITHNDDFILIMPVIRRLMKEYPRLELYIVGELDIPNELIDFQERIKANPFVEWELLPDLIASVDINLAPIEDNIFNEAKSENKWIEAALVKVPTIASNVGAFKQMIKDKETGLLCTSEEEWYTAIKVLIKDADLREKIAKNAYNYVKQECTTVYTGYQFAKNIKKQMIPNIAFVLPTLSLSGGSLVVRRHMSMLKECGYDVLIISEGIEKNIKSSESDFLTIIKCNTPIHGSFDKVVATLWSTVDFLALYPNIKNRYYLVQGYETNFFKPGEFFKFRANQTYNACFDLKYITISQWCQRWLESSYGKNAKMARNGIDTNCFIPQRRKFSNRIRILVEGNVNDFFKNVDESFSIINLLDKEKYEIWYMSYQGNSKDNYRVDRFLHRIPYEEVPSIYAQCDILIKSSILESFSYPPLEMMATGGYVVVAPNEGNVEYLRDGENCLFYERTNLQTAVDCIERIINDKELQDTLYLNGIKTASNREWEKLRKEILALYDVPCNKTEEVIYVD